MGTLAHDGEKFVGNLPISPIGSQYLYFYFLGNITPTVDGNKLTVDINGIENARYTMAQITIDESVINGTIIFPDVYTAGTPDGVVWGTINSPVKTWDNTTCNKDGWTALANAGCVFLPAAGRHERDGSGNYKVFGVGANCYYWTTTRYEVEQSDEIYASALLIDPVSDPEKPAVIFINSKHHRVKGACVRLMRDVTE